MNYAGECDCGDYCAYCHPEMCGISPTVDELKLVKETLADIRRRIQEVEKQL